MRLKEVLSDVQVTGMAADVELDVTGLAYDSRRVRPGDLFFALAGLQRDGNAYVPEALAAGAVAVVVGGESAPPGAPVVRVAEPRKALAQAAGALHGHPSRALAVVGVTGTNGKTTTTYLLESVLREAGWSTGVIGTTGYRIAGVLRPAPFTTPEAPELQALLQEMLTRGVRAAAIEISSHALVQRRCYDLECDVVVFTNLSQDHLDYHRTLEAYLDAKLMLFDGRNNERPSKRAVAVVNADDPRARDVLAAAARGGLAPRTYGATEGADLRLAAVRAGRQGLDFEFAEGGETTPVRLALLGRYNAWNAAAAFAAARALGVAPELAARGLGRLAGVPGRLERVEAGQPFGVIVDYAHTPDALARALEALREHTAGRVLLVFGCGGERDRGKRPQMGRVAATGSEAAWVTNDNPRGEDPRAIAGEVLAGAPEGALRLELDRRGAIAAAIAAARAGDCVLIAGKGHETTQTIGGRIVPFDDRAVAREILARGGW